MAHGPSSNMSACTDTYLKVNMFVRGGAVGAMVVKGPMSGCIRDRKEMVDAIEPQPENGELLCFILMPAKGERVSRALLDHGPRAPGIRERCTPSPVRRI
ncbi:hypothetical protein MGYG_09155 [Nannizzia gypsea CBS 118893]|uniref:Uncharacterized protein n=1 Tax=Arthroderma gypseum (strain ATCC MYA-4604 / CBS 118893) TaxID=535722 RepID=E4V3A8_ARTGP|nr:hypothetical protein MGYG_09155 [Nannizzia gypsea CBS 118893]EFR04482.1 hypothetical protein MGYG_09155 [Nannizzia gypsea CBS 118893]